MGLDAILTKYESPVNDYGQLKNNILESKRPMTQNSPNGGKNNNNKVSENFMGKHKFSCKNCSTVLFSNNELLEMHHTDFPMTSQSQSMLMGQLEKVPFSFGARSSLSSCACYFLKETRWMEKQGTK
jgi:hypothetical protein